VYFFAPCEIQPAAMNEKGDIISAFVIKEWWTTIECEHECSSLE